MFRLWSEFRRFWAADRSLSALLLLLLLLIFVVPTLDVLGSRGRVLVDALFTLLVVAGVVTVSRQRSAQAIVATVGVAALLVRWLGRFAPSDATEIAGALASMATIGILAYVMLVAVFKEGEVNVHRVQGAIAVYLLLGLAWGELYHALSIASPKAFSLAPTVGSDPGTWTYYSFVTLTTVGYGDVTPVAPAARMLAVLEALTGQLYPAILLARLVTLEVSARTTR